MKKLALVMLVFVLMLLVTTDVVGANDDINVDTIIQNDSVFPDSIHGRSIFIATGDITNDGHPDLVITKGGEPCCAGAAVFPSSGDDWDRGTMLAGPSDAEALHPLVAPVRNDGQNWLVYSQHRSGNSGERLRGLRYAGTTLAEDQDVIPTRYGWPGVFYPTVGDLDVDGSLEVWVASPYGSYPCAPFYLRRHVWEPATSSYTGVEVKNSGDCAERFLLPLAADFLGDGTESLIWATTRTRLDLVTHTPGTGVHDHTSSTIVALPVEYIRSYDAGEFDEVPGADLVISSWTGPLSQVHLVSGMTFEVQEIVSGIEDVLWEIRMADLNGDGRSEIYAAGLSGRIYSYTVEQGWRTLADMPSPNEYWIAWNDAATVHWPGDTGDTVLFVGWTGDRGFRVISLTGNNRSPMVEAGEAYMGNEGTAIELSGATASDADNDTLTFDWSVNPFSCTFSDRFALNPTITCTDDGEFIATLTVSDGVNGPVTDLTEISVGNVAPTIALSGQAGVDEGSLYELTLGAVTDPGDDAVTQYIVHWGDGHSDTYAVPGAVSHTYTDGPASPTIVVDVVDEDGTHPAAGTLAIEVNNVAPIVGQINVTPGPPVIEVNTVINATADFTDAGITDTHTAQWDWGDGSTFDGTVAEMDGSGSVTGSHTYGSAGVYTVQLRVTDNDNETGTAIYQFIVVYDPDGGFVTGGGWIDSPAGAYVADSFLTGKATFGFVSKYNKGAHVPTGNTEFQFKAGDLNFHSDSYDWLVVAGKDKAKYKGVGTINGGGNYGFMLTAVDGNPDTFRIKIWDKDAGDAVVYDNKMGVDDDSHDGTELDGGNIKVHKR